MSLQTNLLSTSIIITVSALVSCSPVSKQVPPPYSLASAPPEALGPTSPSTSPSTDSDSASGVEPLPVPAELKHGGLVWAVYLANGAPNTPAFTVAQKRANRLGLQPDYKDANCDLIVDGGPVPSPSTSSVEKNNPDNMLIATYYDTETKARVVAERLGKTIWVGQVKTFCLD